MVPEHPVESASGSAGPLVRRTSVCQGVRAPLRPLALPVCARGMRWGGRSVPAPSEAAGRISRCGLAALSGLCTSSSFAYFNKFS